MCLSHTQILRWNTGDCMTQNRLLSMESPMGSSSELNLFSCSHEMRTHVHMHTHLDSMHLFFNTFFLLPLLLSWKRFHWHAACKTDSPLNMAIPGCREQSCFLKCLVTPHPLHTMGNLREGGVSLMLFCCCCIVLFCLWC
jgi:hypothetical protein